MTKKRFIISASIGVLLFTWAILAAGSSFWLFADIPSLVMAILTPIAMISIIYTPSKQKKILSEILSNKENVDDGIIKQGIHFLKTLRSMIIAASVASSLLGVIGMMANLEDVASVGKNMAVALITVFYGALYVLIFIEPLIGAAKKKLN